MLNGGGVVLDLALLTPAPALTPTTLTLSWSVRVEDTGDAITDTLVYDVMVISDCEIPVLVTNR